MISAAVSLFLHAPINYLLILKLNLGIRGVAIAVAIADFNLLASLLVYVFCSGIYKKSGQSFSFQFFECFDIFEKWKLILKLALPSCVSVCLEWWWYELMILLSGVLSDAAEAVAAMGILIQATSLLYIFPSALSLAVSTRVGNELGANQPYKAKTSSCIALLCATMTSFLAMTLMTVQRGEWSRTFTSDKANMSLTAAAMPILGLCELGNCLQTTGCGVLRGCARPTLGANINLGSFYGVGLPLAVFVSLFMDVGLLGLWVGLLGAQIVCGSMMVFVVKRTDWELEADKSRELLGMEEYHLLQGENIGVPTLVRS